LRIFAGCFLPLPLPSRQIMQGHDIRKKFLQYFADHGHKIVPSSSLVPKDDPTLLFTNAGMVQFKEFFTGKTKLSYKRATSSQKCVRAGGKHNDLENVGHTARHHTFFEMLGNFSFGDYFKAEAIDFGWGFLTKVMKLDADRLWVTIFEDDDDAEKLWQSRVGVPKKRICRFGEKDNFWAMGETGPCGPCSEIIYDQGPKVGCGKKTCDISCDCDRFLEIWNLVFMQFNREKKGGALKPLPKPSIDTGMGLERLCALSQGVESNYEIDLIKGIIDDTAKKAGITYGKNKEDDVSLRVIADHVRASTFLISDGVIPGNEGASYVLRRIIRRAMRHGRKLNLNPEFLFGTAGIVIDIMKKPYPELESKGSFIRTTIRQEEGRFNETLNIGLSTLNQEMKHLSKQNNKILPGELIFKLYDTDGFPVDLTQTIAEEKGFAMDMQGYEREMSKQRNRSKKSGKGLVRLLSEKIQIEDNLSFQVGKIKETKFTGYKSLEGSGRVSKILGPKDFLKTSKKGDKVSFILDATAFYAESGGQVGDTGILSNDSGFKFQVLDTIKAFGGIFLHHGKVLSGSIKEGELVSFKIDQERRKNIVLNHSATHLIHAALRQILGKHVHQKGSLVAPDRLRFDFTHFDATDPGALKDIEDLCNEHVRLNHKIDTNVMPYKKAIDKGAMALFGEKYGDQVRVVSMGDFSIELCGGTHAGATGEIGLIRFRAEGGVASGVRRLEALTGQGALDYVRSHEQEISKIAKKLKSSPKEIDQKLEKLISQQKKLEKDLQKIKTQGGSTPGGNGTDLLNKVKDHKGIKVLAAQVDDMDPKDLRIMADHLKDKLKSGIVALGSVRKNKASLIVLVTKDLTKRYRAGDLVKEMAKHVGGSGGGRADMAQAGGSNPEGMKKALASLDALIP